MDDSGEQTDGQLLRRSRDGDRHAFSELWRRHAPIAVAYARSLGSAPPDPEDVVSDAFLKILHLLRAGKGPDDRFRPYLLTTVRNTWVSASTRSPATLSIDDAEHPVSSVGAIDIDAMVNSTTIAQAFSSLPERWQHALWLSEVEQLPPRAIADVLHLRPNSAAALTYRARDALRKAWIRAHLRQAPEGTEHARVIELLGSYAHDDLSPRSQRVVTAHLHHCADCRAAAGEARHLARAMTLGPLLAGGTGLVIAPLLFPADQVAAATLSSAPGMTGWIGAHAPALQPAVDAAAHANPLLWPVAAAAAVALSVSGSLFVRPPAEPVALGTQAPSLVLPSPAAPADDPAAEADPAPETVPAPPGDDAPAPQPSTRPKGKPKKDASSTTGMPSLIEQLLGAPGSASAANPAKKDAHQQEDTSDGEELLNDPAITAFAQRRTEEADEDLALTASRTKEAELECLTTATATALSIASLTIAGDSTAAADADADAGAGAPRPHDGTVQDPPAEAPGATAKDPTADDILSVLSGDDLPPGLAGEMPPGLLDGHEDDSPRNR